MSINRLLLASLALGVLIGLLAIAQGMSTNPSEQNEAMPAIGIFKDN